MSLLTKEEILKITGVDGNIPLRQDVSFRDIEQLCQVQLLECQKPPDEKLVERVAQWLHDYPFPRVTHGGMTFVEQWDRLKIGAKELLSLITPLFEAKLAEAVREAIEDCEAKFNLTIIPKVVNEKVAEAYARGRADCIGKKRKRPDLILTDE